MNLTITQSEFESVLYVATSKHMEVFNSVEPYTEKAKIECVDYFFGGTETDDGRTITCAKDYICLDAFLNVFRQLDLVLTPTGFGVVANSTTSPASRQRVDALELQLKVSREKAKNKKNGAASAVFFMLFGACGQKPEPHFPSIRESAGTLRRGLRRGWARSRRGPCF